ncbi:MAG TPA: DNRLRE domain-containing protein [bacterium]|nr:DNRLRE domain-containing protein [bacterium]
MTKGSSISRRLFLAVGMLATLSCGAPTGDPVGFQGPERPVKKVTLYPADVGWRDTFYDVFVPTGRHYRLAVGSYGEPNRFRNRALLRFEVGDVPKEVPLSKIRAVFLNLPYLRVSDGLNDDIYAQSEVTIEARPLRRDFDEDRATWWRATRKENWTVEGGDYGPAVADVVVGRPSYQRRRVDLDITALALEWLANPHRNYGLLLKLRDEEEASGAGIKEFYSTKQFDKANTPRLEVIYVNGEGEKAYHLVVPEKECFITEYGGEFGGGEVHGYDPFLDFGSFNGYGRRVLLYFDLSPGATGIPVTASVARARLRLFYQPAARDERVYIAVYRLTVGFQEGAKQDVLELQKFHDNVAYISHEFKSEAPGYVDLYINPLVQEWISGKYPDYGLIIKSPDESAAQTFPRFAAKDNSDPAIRPYLEIEYTLPPDPWYVSPAS